MKKAQGLSLNTIIIAAIVLLVLVILVIVFTGRMGKWGIATQDCIEQGGSCSQGLECMEGYTHHPTWKCYNADKEVDENNICCVVAST